MKVNSEAGFTYIDVMIAIVILLVGILALLSAITGAVFQTKGQEFQLNAKQIATSTMESIMSVKETSAPRLGWNKLGNVCTGTSCAVPQGIFVNGFQTVKADAGPDQIYGTADDTGNTADKYQRQIIITDQCDPDRLSYNCLPTAGTNPVKIRSVSVTVTYYVGTIQRQEILTTVLTDYSYN